MTKFLLSHRIQIQMQIVPLIVLLIKLVILQMALQKLPDLILTTRNKMFYYIIRKINLIIDL